MIMNVNKVVVGCNQEWSLRFSVSVIIYTSVFLSVQWDIYMFYEPQYNEALGMTNDITELWDPRFGGRRRSTMYRRRSVMIFFTSFI